MNRYSFIYDSFVININDLWNTFVVKEQWLRLCFRMTLTEQKTLSTMCLVQGKGGGTERCGFALTANVGTSYSSLSLFSFNKWGQLLTRPPQRNFIGLLRNYILYVYYIYIIYYIQISMYFKFYNFIGLKKLYIIYNKLNINLYI